MMLLRLKRLDKSDGTSQFIRFRWGPPSAHPAPDVGYARCMVSLDVSQPGEREESGMQSLPMQALCFANA